MMIFQIELFEDGKETSAVDVDVVVDVLLEGEVWHFEQVCSKLIYECSKEVAERCFSLVRSS